MKISELECACLAALNNIDPNAEYWTNYFHPGWNPVTEVHGAQKLIDTMPALRRRKLVDAEGRGKFAGFAINDKGRKALEESKVNA